MPKVEKIEMFGVLMVPKNTNQILDEIIRDFGLEQGVRDFASYASDDKKEVHPDTFYIMGENRLVYRVTLNNIEFDLSLLKDGVKVKFLTPKIKKGKFRWAYNIQLA